MGRPGNRLGIRSAGRRPCDGPSRSTGEQYTSRPEKVKHENAAWRFTKAVAVNPGPEWFDVGSSPGAPYATPLANRVFFAFDRLLTAVPISRGDWRTLEPIAQMYVAAILEGGPDILMAQELVRCTALPISPPTWCDPTVADLNGSYSLV